MARKNGLSDEELLAQFDTLEDDPSASSADPPRPSSTTTATNTAKSAKPTPSGTDTDEGDIGAIDKMLGEPRTSTSSRPDTPARSGDDPPRRADVVPTPTSTGSGRSSEEKAATRTDEHRAVKTPPTSQPRDETTATTEGSWSSGVGGWWGGISAMASAAVKQAETAVKEIQKNEEAQKWAEQVKGNYGALRGLSGELRSRALPTFTNILHTLAPPISQHERLQIHITHDLVGYPSLDPLIYQIFSRVMSQVEGGDLLVIQRGSESAHRRTSDAAYRGGSNSGWQDGPWWRDDSVQRNLGAIKGLVEGTKLARVSAEAYGTEFFSAKGGVEEAAKQATVVLSESNPVRSSDIFLAIQAINHTASSDIFGGSGGSASAVAEEKKTEAEKTVVEDPPAPDELVCFAVYLHDPIHGINFSSVSQAFPQRWVDWLDAKVAGEGQEPQLPEEILEIIDGGGIDPREWAAEWIEEVLDLAVGVVAQRYVARRMGVGEGGIGRGKRRQEAVESGGGEAARAI